MVSKKQESGVKIVRNLTPFLPVFAFFYNFGPRKREPRYDTHRAHPVCCHHTDGFPHPDAGVHPAPAWLISLAILNLLRQSSLLLQDWMVGLCSYGLDRRHLNTLQQVERTLREGEQQQQTATSDHNDRHELHEQDLKRITGVTPQEFQTR